MAASSSGEKVADAAAGAGRCWAHTSPPMWLGNGKALYEHGELHLIELHHAIGTALIFLWKTSLQRGQEVIFLPSEG